MTHIAEQFVEWTKLKIRLHMVRTKKLFFKEREVWWASIGVNIGDEQNGKNESFERPVLIVKKFNHELMWILPMSSKEKSGMYYFALSYKDKKTHVVLSQIRTVSSKRLLRKIRTLPHDEFEQIRKKIKNLI